MNWIAIPDCPHYWLQRANVPIALLGTSDRAAGDFNATEEGIALLDLRIADGTVVEIQPHVCLGELPASDREMGSGAGLPKSTGSSVGDALARNEPPAVVDLAGGMVWPCFVDLHTHLDKGHIWPRTPNPDGTFWTALDRARADRDRHWTAEDLYRRMEFGLKCSYAHGTAVVRTHLDSFQEQAATSWQVFRQLRQAWQNTIELQAASIQPLDVYLTPQGEALADLVADSDGLLGGVPQMGPQLAVACDRLFELAKERDLDIDLHVDESGDPNDIALQYVARAAMRHGYEGRVVCGHCCSLAIQPADIVRDTLQLVADAGIAVVSLPQCNLYLQDRYQSATSLLSTKSSSTTSSLAVTPFQAASPNPALLQLAGGQTPRWRGVTLLHELDRAGVPVAVASDNCRDPFHAFGDHDMLEVFAWAVRIAHLDMSYGDWPVAVARTPARISGAKYCGTIAVGQPANLVVCRGRNFSELLARHQSDRVVLRNGLAVSTVLPSYAELDDLMLAPRSV
ncbi:MAG: cytosine deaminase [Cyanobacteria bacterium P01_G01_bin.4]